LDGLELMRRRRLRLRNARENSPPRSIPDHALCKGPGNVTHAMGISLRDNRLDLLGDKLYIEDRGYRPETISWGPRVGISVGTEHHWRCYAGAHASVSGPRPAARSPKPVS
jgi:DNA-3-methyladenine glycosylase